LQYFTGVPVLLVAIHIALSVAVWLAALNLATTARRGIRATSIGVSAEPVAH